MNKPIITVETVNAIAEALRRGNTAEVKRERDNIVVVELRRQVVNKSPQTSKESESH